MTLMDCDIKTHMLTSQGKFCFVFVVLAREREREVQITHPVAGNNK